MNCPSLETVAGWALDELPQQEAEAFEAHYFGCDNCFARAQRLLELTKQLETAVPLILTRERRQALQATTSALPASHVRPGEQATLELSGASPVGLWVMHCELQGVSHVDIEGRGPDGELYFAFADVPFDAERGEVVMPCQWHFRRMPGSNLIHTRLTSQASDGPQLLGEYVLDHVFENV
jgi:hypothetical protein